MKYGEVRAEDILKAFDHVAQSKTSFAFDTRMSFKVTVVRNPDSVGAGRGRVTTRRTKTVKNFMANKRSVLRINNEDDLCLGRAIATALFLVSKKPGRAERKSFLEDRRNVQTNATLELYREASVEPRACVDGRATLDRFQTHLRDRVVLCVHSLTPGGGPHLVYKGNVEGGVDLPYIHLLCHNEHYDVLNSASGFYGTDHYCKNCDRGYNNKKTHPCTRKYACPKCLHKGARCVMSGEGQGVACHDCDVWYPSLECYDRHKTDKVCKTICPVCKKPAEHDHECSKAAECTCKRCGEMYGANHRCYIPQDVQTRKYDFGQAKYIYYDLETMTDQDGRHIPNLCVVHLACGNCGGDTSPHLCSNCPWRDPLYAQSVPRDFKREIIFDGWDALSQFGDFLCSFMKIENKVDLGDDQKAIPSDIIVVAHYARGFDNQFVLKTLLDKLVVKPEVVMVGGKILDMSVSPLKFRDSHNYIPMPLKNFNDTFELENGLKGFFPHLINTTLNQGLKMATLPPTRFYDPDGMTVKDRQKFMAWYSEHENDSFDLQEQLLTYCVQDVSILRRGCTSFINTFLELTTVNPFYECLTLPMACMTTYRRLFMTAQTIGIVPPHGYEDPQPRGSKVASEWLASLERVNGINLERETTIQCGRHAFKTDGFDPLTGVVYEFLGCFWHGCKKCHPLRRDRTVHYGSGTTMTDRYDNTMFRLASLREHPRVSQIVTIWECEYSAVRDPVDYIPEDVKPLRARDAFYGGRTNGIHIHKKCGPGEKIRYVDVCSLYPSVCKYGRFPVGHPRIIHNPPPESLHEFDGIMQCRVTPPTRLFHPLLPYRTNQKLYFPLCRTCADENRQGDCPHSDIERSWNGTFTTVEVQKAVSELGYKVERIYDVWHYDTFAQYDPVTSQDGMFSQYVDTFYKLKQESSGYPEGCDTPTKKEAFVQSVFEKEGLRLDPDNIAYNAGKRAISKLILNSHWGKFGQSNDKRMTEFVDQPRQLYDLVYDPSVVIHDVEIISENMLLVCKSSVVEHETPHQASNPVIASWVTAQARLKLYEALHLLGDKCLYFDTDSVVYLEDASTPPFPLGDSLGLWTDEIEKGNWITEFVSCGPKNYAYKLDHKPKEKTQEVCKIRGFTLNSRTSATLNFDSLVQTAIRHSTKTPLVMKVPYPNQLKRGGYKRKYDVLSVDMTKEYRFCYNKRRIVPDPVTNQLTYTIPYGFKS